jgi:cellulose synthase/poly-beta-1,6-N-acetylglucosamine synthase-like glycosyltransferase
MFTTTFVFLLLAFLIFWAYCGYFLTLYLFALFGNKKTPNKNDCMADSKVAILVPCFNEAEFVKEKVANLMALDYPGELLEIFFLDGSSTDATIERLKEETKDLGNVNVVETGLRGKILQINSVLSRLNCDIIVNTDMDTMMGQDVLLKLVRVFEDDDEVVVAGAHVIPKGALEMELQYWADQNLMRFLESKVHSSSIVIAPCYAFRCGLLQSFPDDCIADDIYISFLANSKGKKAKYIEDAIAYETRTPANLEEMLKHKFRKGNAYIIELLRFMYMLPVMEARWKVIYLTKFLQVIVMPWVIPFFLLSTISQVLSGYGFWKLPAFAFGFLFVSFFSTHRLFGRGRKFMVTERYKKGSVISIFLLTNFILFLNGLSFPFYRQTSSYSKIERGD